MFINWYRDNIVLSFYYLRKIQDWKIRITDGGGKHWEGLIRVQDGSLFQLGDHRSEGSCPRRQGCKEQKGYVREFGDGGVTELKTRNKLIGTQHNNKNKLTRIWLVLTLDHGFQLIRPPLRQRQQRRDRRTWELGELERTLAVELGPGRRRSCRIPPVQ